VQQFTLVPAIFSKVVTLAKAAQLWKIIKETNIMAIGNKTIDVNPQ
jgi:hypothetical protein